MISNWGKTMKISKAVKKYLREDSETLSIATTLVSIETTKCYLLCNMYSAILGIYHHDVHAGWSQCL